MKFSAEKLKNFALEIMQKSGLDAESSAIFADSLVNADMRGIGSHGLTRLATYSRRLQDGLVAKSANIKIIR